MTACHLCGSLAAAEVRLSHGPLKLVSSDVQKVEGGVRWAVCHACGTIQKEPSNDWRAMMELIYARYDINHQSGGEEPMVFDSAIGSGPRSALVARHMFQVISISESGRLLDIGCSNGRFLRTFNSLRPNWNLYGSELDDKWRQQVLALPGVKGFYTGRSCDYELKYDIIVLSHVLEHIPEPREFLLKVQNALAPGGHIVIAVPNVRQNPLDLIIADHSSHFEGSTLNAVLSGAGIRVVDLTTTKIAKEIIAIGASGGANAADRMGHRPDAEQLCRWCFDVLGAIRAAAVQARQEATRFGILGSSIAAAWLIQELDGQVDFLVDEDPNRRGHTLMGTPIMEFENIPAEATVFIPMAGATARQIIARHQDITTKFRYFDWVPD